MPSGNSSLHARAMLRAQRHESITLTWGEVTFTANINHVPVPVSETDRNDGDNLGCSLHAVVSADPSAEGVLRPENVPAQGETFTDEDGNSYRVARRDYTPGLPEAVFYIDSVLRK